MPKVKLARLNSDGSVAGSIVMGIFALAMVAGAYFIWASGSAVTAILFSSCGVALGLTVLYLAARASKFGVPIAEIQSADVRPGDTIRFSFRQPVKPGAVTGVRAFLVLREQVDYPPSAERPPTIHDRLIGQLHGGDAVPAANGQARIEGDFSIPVRPYELRYPVKNSGGKTELHWVIKVRADMARFAPVFQNFAVDVLSPTGSAGGSASDVSIKERFDVYLAGAEPTCLTAITGEMSALLPHLSAFEVSQLYSDRPCLLREDVDAAEAEAIRRLLVAAGATVELRPALAVAVVRPLVSV